jgi:hypothetical protein
VIKNTRQTGKIAKCETESTIEMRAASGTCKSNQPYTSTSGGWCSKTPITAIIAAMSTVVDRWVSWDKLPRPLSLLTLFGLRVTLRKKNLYDTSSLPATTRPPLEAPSPSYLARRTVDGSYNDFDEPATGMAGSRFGRNIPLGKIVPATKSEVMSPNPREVSRALLTRHAFVPATTVNSLAASWLQFMVKDWFSHGTSPKDNPWVVPLSDDDSWPERPMRIMRTPDDPTRPKNAGGMPQTHVNVNSHWWDGSQIYGVNADEQKFVRTGVDGKLHVLNNGLLPLPTDPALDPSRVPGFWLGLEMMRTLFTHEHNAICDRLREAYALWDDEEIFQRARLVNAALLAKIHTVEWTPAVFGHPTINTALRTNWFGLVGEQVRRAFGRISDSEVISGIPGSKTDNSGVPYFLTEEFIAVYRMHPLIRDEWKFRSASDDATLQDCIFREIAGSAAVEIMKRISMTDLLYSFGTLHPGVVTLYNYPRFLQEYERPDGHLQDLGATDILRTRELGVPRYNEFRRLLRLKPAKNFDALTANPEWAKEISRVYNGEIEQVDLIVGLYAERLPAGFASSDTGFRIFLLMASRRLNADRFFTDYYTPAVYSQIGLDWIDDNNMTSVLIRHYPQLRPSMESITNAFKPWASTTR